MGNNAAYAHFEATVIAVYNTGKLDRELLSIFMEQHRGVDIDSGGSAGLRASDGLDVERIVLKTLGRPYPPPPTLPPDCKVWTAAQNRENEEHWDRQATAFNEIARDQFGWE